MLNIADLINETWALEPNFHNRVANLVLSGKIDKFAAEQVLKRKEPYFAVVDPQAGSYYYENRIPKIKSKSGLVAIIPLMGVMTRYGNFCSWGTEDIGAWITEANADELVTAIVLEIDSPGGEVNGMDLFGYIVKNSAKPIVAYVTGMAASGAYWAASQCREIVMESSVTSDVGSIGVLSMHVDSSKYYEKEGHKITIIRSEGSDDKALFNDVEPLTKELKAQFSAEMKPIRDLFVSTVKSTRPKISDNVFSGKMYAGKDAIKLGMADRIGFLGDAVKRADLLGRKQA